VAHLSKPEYPSGDVDVVRRRPAFSRTPSDDQVATVIRAYWRQIVHKFDEAGFKEPRKATRFRIDHKWHDNCRHFAGAKTDGSVLVVAPEIVDLAPDKIVAILAHEGGHFTDLGQPGRFWFRKPSHLKVRAGSRALSVRDDLDIGSNEPALLMFVTLPHKGFGKHLTEWRERSDDEVERVADEIASFVMGEKIGYTGRPGCLVQTLGRGVERPIGLR
jgi:hypothetical protein